MITHCNESTGDRIVGIDNNTPATIAARSEPLHEDDQEFDADLAPDDDGELVDVAGMRSIPRDALKVLLRFIIPASKHQKKREVDPKVRPLMS